MGARDDRPVRVSHYESMGEVRRSLFAVPKMDCPAEESLVRMALNTVAEVHQLSCDLGARTLTVWHEDDPTALLARLEPLRLGAHLLETGRGDVPPVSLPLESETERRTLWVVLILNAAMFVIEIVAGWLAESTGLLADGADMLADATVYGLALYAVGHSAARKLRAARVCGALQMGLALAAMGDVSRRAVFGSQPEAPAMMGVSVVALAVNVTSLLLVARHREGGVHMKATYICTANDVLANLGVIVAGALVAGTGSRVPDLVIGAVIASVVFQGAVRILRLR